MKAALSVDEALARILDGVTALPPEDVPLLEAAGRTLAVPIAARLTQPPFDASAMDGYAVSAADVANVPATLKIVGEAAAGHPFDGFVAPGEAVRIFTGAPLPEGTDAIVIQENTARAGDAVTVTDGKPDPSHVRAKGGDFEQGRMFLDAGTLLAPRHIALAAAMGHATLPVHRRPKVAILATGDELVPPGETPGPGQIIASNGYAIAAQVAAAGAEPRLLGIARDSLDSLAGKLGQAAGADVLVTIGGASVGDHDLVQEALLRDGFSLDFWKIAMRPGKPLMFAARRATRLVGLPGNPVSSIICTDVFIRPLIARLAGRKNTRSPGLSARLTQPLEKNGPRRHYMRATLAHAADADALPSVTPADSQDSALLSVLAGADVLIIREPHAAPAQQGEKVTVLPISF